MNENMEFPGVSGDDIEWLQNSFVQAIKVQQPKRVFIMIDYWKALAFFQVKYFTKVKQVDIIIIIFSFEHKIHSSKCKN